MKKLFYSIIILIFCFTLIACESEKPNDLPKENNDNNNNLGLIIEKEIKLGQEQKSVVLNIDGKEVLVDENCLFEELYYDIIHMFTNRNHGLYSCNISYKIEDEPTNYSNINIYKYQDYQDNCNIYGTYEVGRLKDQNSNDIFKCEEYFFRKDNSGNKDQYIIHEFSKFLYKDEIAFAGDEFNTFTSEHHRYNNNNIPQHPEGTEFVRMQNSYVNAKRFINVMDLFARYASFEFEGNTYEFDSYIKADFKIYDNYIVLKETTPFYLGAVSDPRARYTWYQSCLNKDCLVTQEAYYNISTGKIDCIKIYGNSINNGLLLTTQSCCKVEFDIEIYVHDLKTDEYNQKVSQLVEYIKSNAD